MAKKTKAEFQMEHAIERAQARYGLSLTRNDLDAIGGKIRRGETKLITKQSHRVVVHEVVYRGTTMVAVYDKERKVVVTFLTQEMVVDGKVMKEHEWFEKHGWAPDTFRQAVPSYA
jgi:hypothetical protein